jgi:outer membrane protein TolC
MVTFLADAASTYIQIRTLQQRIKLVRANVELQRGILSIARRRFEAGARNELDVAQAGSVLDQTNSAIPQLQAELRDACNRMCVLLGVPPLDLEKRLGEGPIPTAPKEVIVGIPADLLRRRPDVRRAQHLAAVQAERIGIAVAEFYPMIGINGTLGWQSQELSALFDSYRFAGSFGPAFQWSILHYGRIMNNVRLQEARFQELVANYQNAALRAGAEVESAMVRFMRAHDVARLMDHSVISAQKAADIVARQYKEGDADFNRIALIEQTLVEQQDRQTRAHGAIAQGLIEVYRAAGGGWEVPIPERTFEEIPAAEPSEWATPEETNAAPMPK